MTFDYRTRPASCYEGITFSQENNTETQTLLEPISSLPISPSEDDIEKKWNAYLDNVPMISKGALDIKFVNLLKKVRQQLHDFIGHAMSPPEVASGEDGGLELVWEEGDYYLSVDVINPERIEWFFEDNKNRESFGDNNLKISEFPSRKLQKKLSVWKKV